MKSFDGRSALVIGGGTGIGRATVLALARAGGKITAVARDGARLDAVRAEAPQGSVVTRALDATDASVMRRLLDETDPELVVLSAGVRPRTVPITEYTWEDFSAPWNGDLKMAFELGQAALARPLRPGSTVIFVSSGAGVGGSPLSGGYAGAKRMQMLLAGYLQGAADARKLGIRFVALVPRQLIAGTAIASIASAAYAEHLGTTPEKYMERFGAPLGPDDVARTLLDIARGELGGDATVLGLSSKQGLEPL